MPSVRRDLSASQLLDVLRDEFVYDPERGELRRKKFRQGIAADELGKPIGTPDTRGRFQAQIWGKRYQVDALVWLLETGVLPGAGLRHENDNQSDNRFENLRCSANARFEDREDRRWLTCHQHGVLRLSENRIRKGKRSCPMCGTEAAAIANRARKRKSPADVELARQRRTERERERMSDPERRARKKAQVKAWREANRLKLREYQREYFSTRKSKDEGFRAGVVARGLVARLVRACSLDKGGRRTAELLGYSTTEFKQHIERQFEPWMTWQNHGQWHIDHIVPVSWFQARGITDPATINALMNLQPLSADRNRAKGHREPWDMNKCA